MIPVQPQCAVIYDDSPLTRWERFLRWIRWHHVWNSPQNSRLIAWAGFDDSLPDVWQEVTWTAANSGLTLNLEDMIHQAAVDLLNICKFRQATDAAWFKIYRKGRNRHE